MSKKVTQLPAATVLEDADDFMISQGGVSKKLPASLVGGALGPYGALVFEWNKTDLTQFESTPAFETRLSGSRGAFSVVAAAEHGNVLRYDNGTGSEQVEIWLATAPLIFPSENRELTIEVSVLDDDAGSGQFAGIAHHCDDSGANFHGFAFVSNVGTNGGRYVVNNGVVERTSSSGGSAADTFARYTVSGVKPASGPPRFTERMRGQTKNGTDIDSLFRTGSSAAIRKFVNDAGNNSVLGSTWDALPCDRWGLAFYSQSGNTAVNQVDISSIRVFVS